MKEDYFNNDHEMELRLWEYIDGLSTYDDRLLIDKLIKESHEWRMKYQQLLEVHELMSSSELEEPSMRFTRNVMEGIAKLQIAPATRTYINKKIIWGIAIFFISVIVSFLVYGILHINWSATKSTGSIIGIDLNKIDFSPMFNNTYMNIFMMLNVVLGLMLLDRILAVRRKSYMKEA